MPDWTNQGGPNAGKDPNAGGKILLCLLLGVAIGVILIKLGVVR